MVKVNLDALVPREDFEVKDVQNTSISRAVTTLAIRDLQKNSFFFSSIRKPDFQRETNEWSAEKICGLIESFLEGDLIPAIILWRSAGSYTFVIDGSHRLSALAAWVNDDYGDGEISKYFYEGIIPEEQIKIAEEARILIRKRIGPFKDYELALTNPEKVGADVVRRAKTLGTLAIQLQWVDGDAEKAENSFFKINQEAVPINTTELFLLRARRKPNGLAARAIIRSGTGHKYWSKFSNDKRVEIENIAKDINKILFIPPLKTPVKTLDLPVGGKLYSSQTLQLVLSFVNIVNKIPPNRIDALPNDNNGEKTIEFLKNCRKIAWRINSDHPSSLGLHPAIYFYSQEGRHKTASFYATTALMLDFDNKKLIENFIKVRNKFEETIIEYDYLIQQIVRKYRSAENGFSYVKAFYLEIINKFIEGKSKEQVIEEIIQNPNFNYLTKSVVDIPPGNNPDFSKEIKSKVFIRAALANALKCKICNGYIHKNSISIDHIKRKEDGGLGVLENAQLSHPYCNTSIKN